MKDQVLRVLYVAQPEVVKSDLLKKNEKTNPKVEVWLSQHEIKDF